MKTFYELCQDERLKQWLCNYALEREIHYSSGLPPTLDQLWSWWMEIVSQDRRDNTQFGRLADFRNWWGRTKKNECKEFNYALLACILEELDKRKD